MDRLEKYKQIVRETLETHASYTSSDMPNVTTQLVINKDGRQFVLIISGWHQKEYIHNLAFHIEIKDNRVWIYEDLTDSGIAYELIEKGIPESDIFLAYNQPYNSNYASSKVA